MSAILLSFQGIQLNEVWTLNIDLAKIFYYSVFCKKSFFSIFDAKHVREQENVNF